MRILVVGGVAAGMSAALRAVRHAPDADVVVFERGDIVSYGACGLPYVLSGDVGDWDDLIARTPAELAAEGVDVRTGHDVTDVDAAAGHVTVRAADGTTTREPFDHLLIATGAAPVVPDWVPQGVAGVYTLTDIPDGRAIDAGLRDARRVAIVGAGYIGLELAEAFRARGLDVVMVQAGRVAGRILDHAQCDLVQAELERQGVDVRTGVEVTGLTHRDGRATGVQTDAGDVRADAVVIAVGVRPRSELAQRAGATLGAAGAVAVDDRQRTSVGGVWAAGDCCETVQRVTGGRVYVPLGLTANRMGRVAGTNMAGGDAAFPGIVGTGILKAFSLGVARTGLTQAQAEDAGLDAKSVDIDGRDHAGYYPDARPIRVRLTGERGSGRLLGAQIVARNHSSALRIDVIAALLHDGSSADALADMDLAYAPPFSGVWDVLLIAAGKLAQAVR